jgi:hypothetical protein
MLRVTATRNLTPRATRHVTREATRLRSRPVPFLSAIQLSFGHHDVSSLQAHTGEQAAQLADEVHADAFTSSSDLVFGQTPDLRTAAHEAAHAVQQRSATAGIHADEGDAFERHADEVSEAVVRGESAEGLLDAVAPPSGAHATATPEASATIQRRVMRVRGQGRKAAERWYSSLDPTRQLFDNEAAAQQRDTELQRLLDAEKNKVAPELLEKMDFTAPNLGTGRLAQASTSDALALGTFPAHLGLLMTQGGQVKTSQVSRSVGTLVTPPGKDLTSDTTFHSGQNTYAGIFGTLNIGDERVAEVIGNKPGGVTQLSTLGQDTKTAGRDFRSKHIFQQGPVQADEKVTMPKGRTEAHAEAKAARSKAMTSTIQHVGNELSSGLANTLLEGVGASTELPKKEPTTEPEWDQLFGLFGLAPLLQGNVTLVLNRSSCGRTGHSGYAGGCNQEMADLVPTFQQTHQKNVGEDQAFMHNLFGMMNYGMSVAGPYESGGDPTIPINAGLNMSVHNKMSWESGEEGLLKPLDNEQKKFLARINLAASKKGPPTVDDLLDVEETKQKKEKKAPTRRKKKTKREADPWGGQGPDSTETYQNFGTNHPLHKKFRRGDDDASAT